MTIAPEIPRLRHESDVYDRRIASFSLDEGLLDKYELDGLPQGVAVIGGAARAIALDQLFGESAPIRDVDLVAFYGYDPNVNLEQLSARYMPDDYAYGNGVRVTEVDEYFATRDFTINELAIVDGKIIITERCFNDLRDKRIRFTEYEAGDERRRVGTKMYLKSLLMLATFHVYFGKGEIVNDFEEWPGDNEFFQALMLNKAMEYGSNVFELYRKMAWPNHDSKESVLVAAAEMAKELDFVFRGSEMALRVMRLMKGVDTYWGDNRSLYDLEIDDALAILRNYSKPLPAVISEYE